MKSIEEVKAEALAKSLGINVEEVELKGSYYVAEGYDYEVHNEEEREERVTEYIRNSLWAFTPSFLANMTELPEEVFEVLSEKCENGNDAIERIITKTCGLEAFVDEAIRYDGYGHFMSSYDGEEIELEGDLYAYKI